MVNHQEIKSPHRRSPWTFALLTCEAANSATTKTRKVRASLQNWMAMNARLNWYAVSQTPFNKATDRHRQTGSIQSSSH